MPGMTGPGAGPTRPGWPTSTRPIARPSVPRCIWLGFQGVLQVDGYEAYKLLARRGAVQLAFCWSHVRRPFYELAHSGPAPIAAEALVRIAALYRIEAEIRGRSADDRRAVRQARSPAWCRDRLAGAEELSGVGERPFLALDAHRAV